MNHYESTLISSKDAIELAKTKAFGSLATRASSEDTKLRVYGSYGDI